MKIKCGCGNESCAMIMRVMNSLEYKNLFISIHPETDGAPNIILTVKDAKKLCKYLRKFIDSCGEKEENDEQKAG